MIVEIFFKTGEPLKINTKPTMSLSRISNNAGSVSFIDEDEQIYVIPTDNLLFYRILDKE